MEITIEETKELEVNQTIKINVQGCPHSKRLAKDGCVFFGNLDKKNGKMKKGIVDLQAVDVCIPTAQHGFGLQHFCIFYEASEKTFKIVDLFQGSGTFLLLKTAMVIGAN